MQEEQTQAIANTQGMAAMSPKDQEILKKLRQGSGEDEGSKWLFIPYLTINNKMEDVQTSDGRIVQARCKPEFILNERDGEEYKATPFIDKFNANILKFMYRVQRKLKQDQAKVNKNNLPFFRSLEFKSFKSDIHIRSEKKFLPPMTYQEVKEWAGDENELWGIVYFTIEGEKGPDGKPILRKAEFKGMSRSNLYEYMIKKRELPLAAFYTEFSGELRTTDEAGNRVGNPYNELVLKDTGRMVPNLEQALMLQDELNDMINNDSTPSANAEIIEVPVNLPAGQIEGEVVKEDIKDIETMLTQPPF